MIEKLLFKYSDDNPDVSIPPSTINIAEKINEIIDVLNNLVNNSSDTGSIIIQTCPKCGHDLEDLVLTTYPPIYEKRCSACGWSWSKRSELIRVPFNEESVGDEILTPTHPVPLTHSDVTIMPLNALTDAGTAIAFDVNYNTITGEFTSPED